MKTKFNVFLTLLLALTVQLTFAQNKTITGTITGGDGLPLPGVNIIEKGTTNGTQSDFDGNYSIEASTGSVLVYSFVGFKKKEVTIGANSTVDVILEEDSAQLEEVVITAQGIKSKPRELSYAVTTIGDDEIENTGETNIVNSLNAKSPGVSVVSSSGSVGASANIRIRGNSSITKSNSPLFIVDGVPIDNGSIGNNTAGTDNSNRAIDINQSDIASISILKGIAAQALYGIRASNGVVLITTKKGRSGAPKVSFSSNLQFSEVNQLPDLQTEWAQGRPSGGVATYRGPETGEGFSYGPRINSLEFDGATDYPFDRNGRLVPRGEGNGDPAQAYDPYNFFVTGILQDINASVSGGSDKVRYYLSGGKLTQTGISPREEFDKRSVRADLTADLTEKFQLSASGTYVTSGGRRVQRGSNISGIMLGLLRTTPTFDNGNGQSGRSAATNPEVYELEDGSQRSYRAGIYDNPYWTVAKNPSFDDVNRFIGRFSFDYKAFDWGTFQGRYSYDRYTDTRKIGIDINSATARAGQVTDDNISNEDITTNLFFLFDKELNENLALSGLVGYENYRSKFQRQTVTGDGLTIPGFFQISNTATQTNFSGFGLKKTDAVFADAKLGINNTYFINGTVRNDWSSTLSKDDNDFLSFSVGGSFIFSELFESDIMNYGKLRASYGQTGNDAPIFATLTYYNPGSAGGDGFIDNNIFPIFSTVAFERALSAGNPNIEAEKTNEIEFGGEFKFFNSRVNLDLTYYSRETEDQIIPVDQASTTGFTSRVVNAGLIENEGVEIALGLKPVLTEDFSWSIDANFTTYRSEVIELADGVESITLAGFVSTSSRVVPGESFGAIFGSRFARDEQGNVLIGDDGFPLVNPEDGVIGDPIPDWQAGIRNTFTYKNLSASILFDIRQGGDVWCGTCGILDYFGTSQETGDLRDVTDFVFDGVVQSTGETNTQEVALADPAAGLGGNRWIRYGFGGVSEDYIFDSSWVRLREASLTYNLTGSLIDSTFLDSASVTLSGRNLWLSTDYPGVDPETNLTGDSNGIGLDYFNQPNTRSYAVALKFNF